MCTVDAGNIPGVRNAERSGYKELNRFVNRKTGNTVIIYSKLISEVAEKLPEIQEYM
jgi:hypothetical protein